MKVGIAIIIIALIGLGAFVLFGPSTTPDEVIEEPTEAVSEVNEALAQDGEYEIVASLSKVNWAGKKPLIDGYINSGTLSVTTGTILLAGASSTGSFEIDMSTLSVSETKAKPGAESLLEEHLKGERWFNTEEFPTAEFSIISITSQNDIEDPFLFDVVGGLTMKGETNEVSFVARIYENEDGNVQTKANFEIDRTLWGITSGSGSFFDDLADQVIDDMVALSFSLVAKPKIEKIAEEVEEEATSTPKEIE